MKVSTREISWDEPPCLEVTKERAAEMKKGFPPLWRVLSYCIGLPIAALLLAMWLLPNAKGVNPLIIMAGIVVLVCVGLFAFIVPRLLDKPLPLKIRMTQKCLYLGNTLSKSRCGMREWPIEMKQIERIAFEMHFGMACLVLYLKGRSGNPLQRKFMLPPDDMAKERVRGFLCDCGLSHLCK